MTRATHGGTRNHQAGAYPGPIAQLLIWTLLGLLSYAHYYLQTSPRPAVIVPDLLGWIACYYAWALFTPPVFRLVSRWPLITPHRTRNAMYLALAGIPLSYFATVLSIAFRGVVGKIFHHPAPTDTWWLIPASDFGMHFALYTCIVGTAVLLRRFVELHEKERYAAELALEKSRLEASLQAAELETLRMRLNPHFLFNSLQNISVLAQQDPKCASQMLAKLGDLLRNALRRDIGPESTLESEVDLTKAYLAIEKMRFADRLSTIFEIERATERALVPSFLLQPLVENAVNHGLRAAQQTGIILLRSMRDNDRLVLTVIDNGIGPPSERLSEMQIGVGLSSTTERLARMYPGQHSFSLRKIPEGGTEVRIALPLKVAPARDFPISNEQASIVNRR